MELAKCYETIPPGMVMAVWILLICNWANE